MAIESTNTHPVFVIAITIMMCIMVYAPHNAQAGSITCQNLVQSLSSCLTYLRAGGNIPASCCAGVENLNRAANTTPARQQACKCIKTLITRVSGAKIIGLAASLPRKCKVNIGYPISYGVDCNKVHV